MTKLEKCLVTVFKMRNSYLYSSFKIIPNQSQQAKQCFKLNWNICRGGGGGGVVTESLRVIFIFELFQQARVVLYKGGNSVQELIFDAKGSDKLNWFAFERLKNDPWSDIRTEPRNIFTIGGDNGRSFIINSVYNGCPGDEGWMVIVGPPCDWEKSKPPNAVLYSVMNVHTNWNDDGEGNNGCLPFRVIFNWVSKVIRDCVGFVSLRCVIGLENSRHPLNQSDAKLKLISTWSLAFSRAWGRLHVFTLSSYWLLVKFTFALIGRCDYFGFGFTTLNRKALYTGKPVGWRLKLSKWKSKILNWKFRSIQDRRVTFAKQPPICHFYHVTRKLAKGLRLFVLVNNQHFKSMLPWLTFLNIGYENTGSCNNNNIYFTLLALITH